MSSNTRKRIVIILSGFLILGGMTLSFSQQQEYPFSEENRDPFSPLINKKGVVLMPREIGFIGLSLKGIIYSDKGAVVIINDEVLREGDSIGDYTIVQIEKKKVILKKNNEGFILKLEEQ